MLRILTFAMLMGGVANLVLAQSTSGKTATTTCTFQDGKELSLRYSNAVINSKTRLPDGELWSPGGEPMLLFTQVEIMAGNSQIAIGAYSSYVIRQRDHWTFVLNKDVREGAKYDKQEDVLRAPMQAGRLSDPQPFSVAFAHIAPKQCNLRIYLGKTGTWVEFKEK